MRDWRRLADLSRLESFVGILRSYGYKPAIAEDRVTLRNCPFDALAKDHRDVVCNMSRARIGGLMAGLNADNMTTVFQQHTGQCCVTINRHDDLRGEGLSDERHIDD